MKKKDMIGENFSFKHMIQKNQAKYLLVNLLSRRARELNDGSRPLVKLEGPHTHFETAIAEGMGGALNIVAKESEKVAVDLVENN